MCTWWTLAEYYRNYVENNIETGKRSSRTFMDMEAPNKHGEFPTTGVECR